MGNYLLEDVLGSGGMGVVHLASSASGRRLAVKVVHAEYASDPEFRARFRQEVTAARRVSGAFTAPVVDADPDAERPWMATMFIEGPTLSERVKRNGPLDSGELLRLSAGLAEGLRDIHRAGVVHRDLKPSNVLLAADGPKVIDFGISRPADSDLRTETGKLIGTPPFMAPEQFQRPREVGPAADVFAMASVLVHAATGRGPFDSDSPYVVAYQVVHNEPDLTGVPAELAPLIRECLAKDPADRPTADDIVTSLRQRAARRATALVPARSTPPGSEDTPGTAAAGTPDTHLLPRLPLPVAGPAGPVREEPVREQAGAEPVDAVRRPRAHWARRPPIRWVATATALAAVVAAAGFAGVHLSGHGKAGAHSVARGGGPFHAWRTSLGGSGSSGRGMPACTADATGVYCAAPGVAAARLDRADGHVVWTVKDSATRSATVVRPPVLSDGLLFAVTGAGRLEALDPASGKARWGVGVTRYPTIRYTAGSVLLSGADDGSVRSLDDATGRTRWTHPLDTSGFLWAQPGNEGAGGGGSGSGTGRARDAAGTVFAAAVPGSGDATDVSAVDPADGRTRWTRRIDGVVTPFGVSGGDLYLLAQDSGGDTDAVVTLDAATHAVRRFPLPTTLEQAQATVAGTTVYLMAYTGSLLAVDTGDGGRQLWRMETSVTRASSPTVAGGNLYVSAGDGRLLGVDARRGTLLAQTAPRLGDAATVASTLPAPVVTGHTVVATAPDGSVFAVNGSTPARW